jgi:predicted transcriptional regulator
MERDLINLAILNIYLKGGKDLKEVKRYLLLKYHLEVDDLVIRKRLAKIIQQEVAVA